MELLNTKHSRSMKLFPLIVGDRYSEGSDCRKIVISSQENIRYWEESVTVSALYNIIVCSRKYCILKYCLLVKNSLGLNLTVSYLTLQFMVQFSEFYFLVCNNLTPII